MRRLLRPPEDPGFCSHRLTMTRPTPDHIVLAFLELPLFVFAVVWVLKYGI
jgi:hypothetical protein